MRLPLSRRSILAQVDRGGLALVTALKIEGQLLPLVQIADARAFDCGYVYEHILRAVLGLNETIAFLGVEPLHGSGRHCRRRPSHNKKFAAARSERCGQTTTWTGGLVRRSIARGGAGRTMKKSTLTTWGRMVGFTRTSDLCQAELPAAMAPPWIYAFDPIAGVRDLARRSNAIRVSSRFGNALSGTILGPSDGARSGSSCVSMNTAATPTATAARANTSTKRRSPPELPPCPPGCCTE